MIKADICVKRQIIRPYRCPLWTGFTVFHSRDFCRVFPDSYDFRKKYLGLFKECFQTQQESAIAKSWNWCLGHPLNIRSVGSATAQITISLQNVQNQLQGSLPGQGLAKDDNGLDFGEVGIILNRLLGPQFTINPIQVGVGFAHIILIKKTGQHLQA